MTQNGEAAVINICVARKMHEFEVHVKERSRLLHV